MRFPLSHHPRYKLRRELGEGAFGTSYLVEDTDREELVVLALLERARPEHIERFKRDLEALVRLSHPNLVPFVGWVSEDGHLGYTREYVQGRDLRAHVTAPALEAPSSVDAAEEAAAPAEEAAAQADPPAPISERQQEEADPPPGAGEDAEPVHTPLDLSSLELGPDLVGLSEDTDEVGLIISELSQPRARQRAPFEEVLGRLTRVLPELLAGLEHLHHYKRVHGTLHPGCLLIEEGSGRAKIADFGLVQILVEGGPDEHEAALSTRAERSRWRRQRLWTYSAPERFEGQPPSPAGDIYSLGCVLYELLSGRPPFEGSETLGQRHRDEIPLGLLELEPSCPSSWAQLVDEMLHKDPARRPELAQVREALEEIEPEPTPLPPSHIHPPSTRMTRVDVIEQVLERAERSWRRRSLTTMVMVGPAGVGKRHVLEQSLARLARRGWLILRGRCHADEIEPFHGWSALIDQLLDSLAQCPAELIPRQARREASALFPRLGGEPEPGPRQRLELAAALRELLAALSTARPVLLAFDDLHLADRDTLELLHDFRAGDRPFEGMILATSTQPARELFPDRDREQAPELRVRPLNRQEARVLLEQNARPAQVRAFEPLLKQRAQHSPLLIKELLYELQRRGEAAPEDARALIPGGEDLEEGGAQERAMRALLGARIAPLEGEALELLRTLAITAGPTPVELLRRSHHHELEGEHEGETLELDSDVQESALTRLCTMRLARRQPSRRRGRPSYRIAHELCRRLVLEETPQTERAARCEALAEALEGEDVRTHAARFDYLRRAGLHERAAAWVQAPLDEARARLAYARAAELQRWRLEHAPPPEEPERREQIHALSELEAASGRYAISAELLQQLGEEFDPGQAQAQVLGDAAEMWFNAGQLDEAASALQGALRYFGERFVPGSVAGWFSRAREWLGRLTMGRRPGLEELEDRALSPEDRLRRRIYTLALRTHGMLNGLQAPLFQRRLEQMGRKRRDRRALAEASLARAQILLRHDPRRALRQAGELLSEAAALYEVLGDSERMAEVLVTSARLQQARGDWRSAHALFDRAEASSRASSAHARLARAELDFQRGRLALEAGQLEEAARMIEALFHEERHLEPARLRGHQLAADEALLRGRPDEAQAHLEEVEAALSSMAPSPLQLWSIQARTRLDLAMGRPEVALGQLDVHFEQLGATGYLRAPGVELTLAMTRGWALAAQLERGWALDGPRRRERMRQLRRVIRQLERLAEHMSPQEQAMRARLQARQEWLAGHPRRSLRTLDGQATRGQVMGALETARIAEARSFVLAALERDGALTLREQAHWVYAQLQICPPLILEGWPVPEELCALRAD